MNKREVMQSLKVVILGLTLSVGLSYVFAWTGPTQTAPAGNVPAPINAGGLAQFKAGFLSVGKSSMPTTGTALDVNGAVSLGNLLVNGVITITGGSPSAGKVLTSTDSTGLASWQIPANGTPATSYVTCTANTPGVNNRSSCVASCPALKRVVGGGCTNSQPANTNNTMITQSAPTTVNTVANGGWVCSVFSAQAGTITGTAICQ